MAVANIDKNAQDITILRRQDCTPEIWERVERIDLNNLKPAASSLDRFTRCDLMELVYENYSDFRIVKGMPKSVFADQFGYDMQREIGQCMYDFYAGRISRSDVQDFFNKCCSSMRSYRTQQQQTTGTNPEDNQKIAAQVYEVFAKENQRAACRVNYEEGAAINAAYGGLENDWAYYNADYYYKCVEGNAMLREMLGGLVDKWEIPAVDPDEIEANSCFTLDGGFDFNSGWNFHFRNQAGRASMADESVQPPADFIFFFKEKFSVREGYSNNTGYLSILSGGRKYSRDIPFLVAKDGGTKGEIYSLCELLADKDMRIGNGKDYSRFLSSITVFTRWYSCHTGINNRFGNFAPKRD